MKIINKIKEPAIIDLYYDELEGIDLEEIFLDNNFLVQEYGDLDVDKRRFQTLPESKSFKELKAILNPSIIEITKILLDMDKKRYPNFQLHSFYHNCRIDLFPTVDHPGFYQNWHLDNRFIVISGSINVIDNETRTHFSTDLHHHLEMQDHKIIHKGQNMKNYGTAWLNTELTWHCVPTVTILRKTILFNVFFY